MGVCMGTCASAHADTSGTDLDAQYKELVTLGNQALSEGNLPMAARQFLGASGLKRAPNVLLRVVSIFGDLASRLPAEGHQCDATRSTLERFFKACTRQTKPRIINKYIG